MALTYASWYLNISCFINHVTQNGETDWKVCDGLPLNQIPYGRSNHSRIHFEYFESGFKLRTESFQTCLPSVLIGLFWPTCSRLTGRYWEMYPWGFWTRKLEFRFSYLSHSCWLSCFPSMLVFTFPFILFLVWKVFFLLWELRGTQPALVLPSYSHTKNNF